MSIFLKKFGPYSKLRTANWPIAWRKQTQPYNNDILLERLCYVLLFSCANKNFLFWHLSNDCQIVRPALVSGPPKRKKPYNKHLISLVFSVHAWAINRWKKLGPWFTVRTENSANKRYLFRRGSRINNDRFPNERRRRQLLAGSGEGGGGAPSGSNLDF